MNAGAEAQRWGALLVTCVPVALVGFVLATPDAPLLAAVSVTLVALDRALAAPRRSAESFRWWCAAGVTLGVAFCAKYTAVLVPFGVLLAMVVHPRLRARLAEPGPYVAAVVAIAVFLPVVAWNARHEWVSFAFQLNHGLGTPKGSPLSRELNLIGGQLGLISPVLAIMMGIAVVRALRGPRERAAGTTDRGDMRSGGVASGRTQSGHDDTGLPERRFMLGAIATVIVAFFAFSALRKPVEANWPAPALVAALPLLAAWRPTGAARRWLTAGCALAAACTLLIIGQALFRVIPLAPRRDPVNKAYGWDQVAVRVAQLRAATTGRDGCTRVWVAADRYQDASQLAFHLPEHPTVFSLNIGGRPNQYDLWPTFETVSRADDCVLLVVDDGAKGVEVVQRHTATGRRADDAGLVMFTRDRAPIGRRHLWLVRGAAASGSTTAE